MDRRTELTEGALAYVLAEGLIGLSLRPLARRLGTSDRMLIYHFGGKENLITEVLALANRRIAESIGTVDPPVHTVGDLVRYAWAALRNADTAGTTRLYLELCVLSAREPARWTDAHRRLREPWLELLRGGLAALGVPAARLQAHADLILDSLDGLLLDRLVSPDPSRADAAANALADLLDHSGVRST